MLADPEVEVASREGAVVDIVCVFDQRQRRRREVGRAADQLGHLGRRPLEHRVRGLSRGGHRPARVEGRDLGVPAGGQLAADEPLEFLGERGMLLAVGVKARLPRRLLRGAFLQAAAEVLERLGRNVERLLARPPIGLLGELDLLLAERRAVRGRGVLLVRAAIADVGADDDQRRPVLDRDRLAQRAFERVERDLLLEVLHVPAVRLEPPARVLGEGDRGVALDRDVVAVVEGDQAAEPEMARERGRLVRDSLLHVTVGGDHERVVVDDLLAGTVEARGEHPLGERHPDGVRDPLSQRPGRDLDSGRAAVLGVPGGLRSELPEALDVLEADVVSTQVQRRVQQHRGVPAGQHEAVAVGPGGIARVVLHHPRI